MTTPTTSRSDQTDVDDVAEAPVRRPGGPAWSRGPIPILLAVAIFLGIWQIVVWSGWRPDYLLPGPVTVFSELGSIVVQPEFWQALGRTLVRAVAGFGLAVLIGTAIGLAAARSRTLRAAIGSLVTGLQTMPSVVWFPLAILLLGLGESAIMFVVILGAAPSVANGVLSGVDQVPPAYFRLGRVLGAEGWRLYRYIVIPAALPSYVGGLNQGWAFAWRSLMAGELLVVIPGAVALGNRLAFAQEFGDAAGLLAYMLVILVVGMLADAGFSAVATRIRRRRGLAVR
ncbi:MAG TPA: ABC transporter permease [Propionicimonas sp.]|jgi:NitT/TauT family transport system permease protein|uniref:ABC transporter permease n=1 Tax=Propionicimonas sp. TaxID=1955623 RepID=UPI002F41158E